MPETFEAPADTQDRLDQLAALLRECRSVFTRLTHSYKWEPNTQSIARQDLAQFESTPAVNSPRLLLAAACTFLETAVSHCGGMAALFESREVLAAPWPLGRSILETCARTTWLIGNLDPADPPENRLARVYIEYLYSFDHAYERAKVPGGASPTALDDIKKKRIMLRQEIRAMFPGTNKAALEQYLINGIESPGLIATTRQFFERIIQTGVSGPR